jgi:hypothetical protein
MELTSVNIAFKTGGTATLTQNKEERVKQIRTPDYSVLNLSALYSWSLPVGYVIPWHWLIHQIV